MAFRKEVRSNLFAAIGLVLMLVSCKLYYDLGSNFIWNFISFFIESFRFDLIAGPYGIQSFIFSLTRLSKDLAIICITLYSNVLNVLE